MNELVYTYFIERFRSLRQVGTEGWYSFNDPFGNKKDGSSRINFEYNAVMDWRTGKTFSAIEYIQEVEGLSSYAETCTYLGADFSPTPIPLRQAKIRPEVSNVPDGLKLDALCKDNYFHKGVNYLLSRGFELDFLMDLALRVCIEGKYAGRILIPFIENDKCIYFTARDYTGKRDPKYSNPVTGDTVKTASEALYNSDALKQRVCYIVEGVFCAWTLMQAGIPAIATCGWSLSEAKKELLIKAPCTEFIVIADKGFYKKSCREFAFLRSTKTIRVVNFDGLPDTKKDVNDVGAAYTLELALKANPLKLIDCI